MAKLRSGSRIGRYPYLIVRELDSGNMAKVWLATEGESTESISAQTVVIKISRVHDDHGEFFEDTIYNEADRLRTLDHPGIVAIRSVQSEPPLRNPPFAAKADMLQGRPWFLVLEYLAGGSLESYLDRQGSLPVDSALALTRGLATALEYLHRKEIVHLDIKPENILFRAPLTTQGPTDPVLIDFGISRRIGQEGLEARSLQYTPPERLQDENQIPELSPVPRPHPSMDIYSLGVVFYQMLTGRRPFGGRTRHRITSAIRKSDPTIPSKYRSQLPTELDNLVLRMIDKDPAKRPTAEDLANELRAMMHKRGYVPPAGGGHSPTQPVVPGARRRAAMRKPSMVVIIVALLGIGLLLVAGSRNGSGNFFDVAKVQAQAESWVADLQSMFGGADGPFPTSLPESGGAAIAWMTATETPVVIITSTPVADRPTVTPSPEDTPTPEDTSTPVSEHTATATPRPTSTRTKSPTPTVRPTSTPALKPTKTPTPRSTSTPVSNGGDPAVVLPRLSLWGGESTAVPEPTPTRKPTPSSATATVAPSAGNGFTSPAEGATVSGSVEVRGIAKHHAFEKWQIDFLRSQNNEEEEFVDKGEREVSGRFLNLDSTRYPNGTHQLRLRVVRSGSNYDEYFVTITIRN